MNPDSWQKIRKTAANILVACLYGLRPAAREIEAVPVIADARTRSPGCMARHHLWTPRHKSSGSRSPHCWISIRPMSALGHKQTSLHARQCPLYPRKRTWISAVVMSAEGPEADFASYSRISSARERSEGGTVRPSALAVLRLITNSYLVALCTGRSAGFSPLRMRST